MVNATFEDHPTDPNKVILRKKPHLDKGRDYEEGFIDGMQHQMQLSVDKAVNAMSRQWVGLTDEEIFVELERVDPQAKRLPAGLKIFAHYLEARLREKNTPQDGKCKYCTNGCVACDARRLPNVLP